MIASVDVVVPVYGNRDTLHELHARLSAALAHVPRVGFVYVDDASPDDSRTWLEALARQDARVDVLALDRNVGQHQALLYGLARADADLVVMLDADLQDPPEAIPQLLEVALTGGWEVTFGGRRGAYETRPRRITSYVYKHTIAVLTGLPSDAGLFLVLTRRSVEQLLAMRGPEPMLTAMIGAARLRWTSVPIERASRPIGDSAYSARDRATVALRGLRWAVAARRGRARRADDSDLGG